MQRYRMTQPSLQLKPANKIAEGAIGRSSKDGSVRPLLRPAVAKEKDIAEAASVQSSPSTGSRGPVARFFSRMIEQLVNDFASGAAATHPEAYLMWLDFNQADGSASQRDGGWTAADAERGIFTTRAERRIDMHAYLSQSRPIAANRVARSSEGFADATPVNLEQPLRSGWLSSMTAAAAAKIRELRETRRCIAALYGMDDRMLKDIGISRYEIEQVSRYGRSRK